MVVNRRPLKRAKRRVTADLCDFLTFPAPGDGISDGLDGPFRVSVREFLVRHARLPPPSSVLLPSAVASPHLIPWRITFRVGDLEGAVVELNVVEEDVLRSKSIYCDHCRIVGWSGHPVCGKRYHFIIRNDSKSSSGCRQTCVHCGTLLPLPDARCIACKYEMRGEELEDWPYVRLEDSTHLLHGVVHANGYGHLLRVNGQEGGSKYLTGCDIMGFWDRICKMLHVRKVSVLDVSKKYGMEYRLLHAVTTGRPWYGDWGYRFGAGSFAMTAVAYQKAVETLSNIPLSIFFSHARSPRTPLQNMIGLYQSMSDHQLVTVGNLFCYVTLVLHESHEQRKPEILLSKWAEATSGASVTWTNEDVEQAEKAMIKVLRAVGGSKWVTWRALRGATFHAVKSPELLDHCLKELGGKATVDGMVVAARCNAETSAIEYRLEAASNQTTTTRYLSRPSADQLLQDLKFLFDALLNPATMQSYRPQTTKESAHSSASKLLDCKQFIKHYDEPASDGLPPSSQFVLRIWCHVELIDHPTDYTAPPSELLILPITATIADLKEQATRAFQETYLIFRRFQAERLILDRGDVSDFALVRHILGSNGVAWIRGRCVGVDQSLGKFRMERGLENWIVDCDCGAKDDDGERMMACDACGVWQHTRCAGISDHDEVPAKFACRKCIRLLKPKGRSSVPMKSNTSGGMCKDEMEPSKSDRFGSLTSVR